MSTNSEATVPLPFWERQFGPQVTDSQIAFDVMFGLLFPLICLVLDPIVFRLGSMDAGFGGPMGTPFVVGAVVAIGLGFITLISWLSLRRAPAFFAGLMSGSALFAVTLGIVMLPLSLLGMLFLGVGILGMSPFITAFVFGRNAIRASRMAREAKHPRPNLLAAFGFVIACGVPLASQGYVWREVSYAKEMVLSENPDTAARGLAVLKIFRGMATFDDIATAYQAEKNEDRRKRLAVAYDELTGMDIETRLRILDD